MRGVLPAAVGFEPAQGPGLVIHWGEKDRPFETGVADGYGFEFAPFASEQGNLRFQMAFPRIRIDLSSSSTRRMHPVVSVGRASQSATLPPASK